MTAVHRGAQGGFYGSYHSESSSPFRPAKPKQVCGAPARNGRGKGGSNERQTPSKGAAALGILAAVGTALSAAMGNALRCRLGLYLSAELWTFCSFFGEKKTSTFFQKKCKVPHSSLAL